MKNLRPVVVALLCLLTIASTRAGDLTLRESDSHPRDLSSRFDRGSWELEDLVGTFFLFDRRGNVRPTIDYALNTTRLGIMIYQPTGPGILRGNLEFLGELFGGPIFHGAGNFVFGNTYFFRYNFIQRGARLVPYFQAGGGWIYTDIEHGPAAGNAVSTDFNFNLQAIGGVRFLLNDTWSLNAEASYRHISNASLSKPNYGIDQLGGAIGAGFSF